MKTAKRILMFVLTAILVISAAACGAELPSKEDAVKTAVTAYVKSTSADILDVSVKNVKIVDEKDLEDEIVASYDLGKDDIIFEVTYDVKVADGVDANLFAIPNGEVDGQTVKDISRVGVIRCSDGKYSVDPKFIGTGL